MPWVSKTHYQELKRSAFFGKELLRLASNANYKLNEVLKQMATREELAEARFGELIGKVRDFIAAKDAEIANLRGALANADQTAAQRVQEALDADSDHDAKRLEDGAAALEELIGRANQGEDTVPEPEPAETGPGSSVPAEDAQAPADHITPEVVDGPVSETPENVSESPESDGEVR